MAFRIYTKTGDAGQTGLFGGERRAKDDLRIESYGTVDELNAFLGLLRDHLEDQDLRGELLNIQSLLFNLGAQLATAPGKETSTTPLAETDVATLEESIDWMDAELYPLKNFILPGGHPAVSYCHVARTVCRRAERRVVALAREETIDPLLIRYLNRLSDYLFVLARYVGHRLRAPEVIWKSNQKSEDL